MVSIYGGRSVEELIFITLIVRRIIKTALLKKAKILEEASRYINKCVSEFISFITSEGR
jgi:histone H3/H4